MIVTILEVCVVLLLCCLCWFCFQSYMDCENASPCVLLSGILPLSFLRDLVTFVLGTMVDMFGRSFVFWQSQVSSWRYREQRKVGHWGLEIGSAHHTLMAVSQTYLLHPSICRQRLWEPLYILTYSKGIGSSSCPLCE